MQNTRQHSTRRAKPTGWLTSDADEIERRRLRGLDEPIEIEPETPGDGFFGVYRSHSDGGQTYRIEIRSLTETINTCSCPDHRINGLGTCKHLEAALARLQHRRKRAFNRAAKAGSPWVEIFLDRRDRQVRVRYPGDRQNGSKARDLLAVYFSHDDRLVGSPLDTVPAMQRAIGAADAELRGSIRVSQELNAWLETLDLREQRVRARRHFEAEVAVGNASLDLVKHALYAYQQEGMLHLAFTGRALLADEMGLGKTVQAVAACELLRRMTGIRRVLVISPASLKGEWEEQIAKFTDLPSSIIQGPRAKRLRQYRETGFFFLANYEQIRGDVAEINSILAPDVIVLDEAQRIKNWQTKTAVSIKRLESRYAFVLTGTPLENRIDEIYSIVQYLDPQLFGPLFRFNREFYQLDENGRAVGYKNLDVLHERIRPIMLRRRKEQVEGQLPGRTIKTYLVPMHKEQTLRYEEYEGKAARLAAMARKRPLTKKEMQALQQCLACMRMLCDTPYILDQDCRVSPKLKELDAILREILEGGDHKIIVFSEWTRMLKLVREQIEDLGLDCAWHTGEVPQPTRRAEIRRFRQDPLCRVFLSTDSGSVGLNLQVASVVINVDLPWNPARLEQRIARAWRKHQTRAVRVINLVTENSIEHRMVSLLEQKRALADNVVDGKGEREMALPSGRAAFLDRLGALFTDEPIDRDAKAADPFERLTEAILPDWHRRLDRMEVYGEADRRTVVVVAEQATGDLQDLLTDQLQALFPEDTPRLTLMDRAAYASIQQLVEVGVLQADAAPLRALYQAPPETAQTDEALAARLAAALAELARGERKQRMASVLGDGGFPVEALVPMREAVDSALGALVVWREDDFDGPPPLDLIESALVRTNLLPAESLRHIDGLREAHEGLDDVQAKALLAQSQALFSRAASVLAAASRPDPARHSDPGSPPG
jgi:ERCC4-related helicase